MAHFFLKPFRFASLFTKMLLPFSGDALKWLRFGNFNYLKKKKKSVFSFSRMMKKAPKSGLFSMQAEFC